MTALLMANSGALQMLMTRGGVGTSGGYSIGNYGSLSPNDFRGEQINRITNLNGDDLHVTFADFSLPQTFFHSIKLSLGTFKTADADTYSGGEWVWFGAGFIAQTGSEQVVMS